MSKKISLISGCNGKPEAYKASRKVSCSSCDAFLEGGNGFKIPIRKGLYKNKPLFCFDCLKLIIEQTRRDLIELENLIPT